MVSKIMMIFSLVLFPSRSEVQDEIEHLNLESPNYLLYSIDSDEILAKKNHDIPLTIGSMNKILTVITALELIDEKELNNEIVISKKVLDSINPAASIADFKVNQVITLKEAFYGILLPSGADAVAIVSDYLFDDQKDLVDAMNKKAEAIGLQNTKIKNIFGFDAEGQYTTLEDLLTLLRYALENETFYSLYTTHTHPLSKNPNHILVDGILDQRDDFDAPFIKGAKSGFTRDTKRGLSTLSMYKDMKYIFLSTQASGEYYGNNGALKDAITVHRYMLENYHSDTLLKKGDLISVFSLENLKEKIPLHYPKDIKAILPNVFHYESFKVKTVLKDNLKLPLRKGDVIGEYTIQYKEDEIETYPLTLEEDIDLESSYHRELIIFFIIIFLALMSLMIFLRINYRKSL